MENKKEIDSKKHMNKVKKNNSKKKKITYH